MKKLNFSQDQLTQFLETYQNKNYIKIDEAKKYSITPLGRIRSETLATYLNKMFAAQETQTPHHTDSPPQATPKIGSANVSNVNLSQKFTNPHQHSDNLTITDLTNTSNWVGSSLHSPVLQVAVTMPYQLPSSNFTMLEKPTTLPQNTAAIATTGIDVSHLHSDPYQTIEFDHTNNPGQITGDIFQNIKEFDFTTLDMLSTRPQNTATPATPATDITHLNSEPMGNMMQNSLSSGTQPASRITSLHETSISAAAISKIFTQKQIVFLRFVLEKIIELNTNNQQCTHQHLLDLLVASNKFDLGRGTLDAHLREVSILCHGKRYLERETLYLSGTGKSGLTCFYKTTDTTLSFKNTIDYLSQFPIQNTKNVSIAKSKSVLVTVPTHTNFFMPDNKRSRTNETETNIIPYPEKMLVAKNTQAILSDSRSVARPNSTEVNTINLPPKMKLTPNAINTHQRTNIPPSIDLTNDRVTSLLSPTNLPALSGTPTMPYSLTSFDSTPLQKKTLAQPSNITITSPTDLTGINSSHAKDTFKNNLSSDTKPASIISSSQGIFITAASLSHSANSIVVPDYLFTGTKSDILLFALEKIIATPSTEVCPLQKIIDLYQESQKNNPKVTKKSIKTHLREVMKYCIKQNHVIRVVANRYCFYKATPTTLNFKKVIEFLCQKSNSNQCTPLQGTHLTQPLNTIQVLPLTQAPNNIATDNTNLNSAPIEDIMQNRIFSAKQSASITTLPHQVFMPAAPISHSNHLSIFPIQNNQKEAVNHLTSSPATLTTQYDFFKPNTERRGNEPEAIDKLDLQIIDQNETLLPQLDESLLPQLDEIFPPYINTPR